MSTFTQAAISYHGIPPDVVVRSDVHTGDDGVLYLTVQIPLKDEDMEPIVKRMGQLTEQAQQDEPVFVPDDINMQQLRDDYAALSPQEKGKYKSFQRYKAHRMAEAGDEIMEAICRSAEAQGHVVLARGQEPQPSEGVGGRKVQHVDLAEEQEAVSELPAAVWVPIDALNEQQRHLQSDGRQEVDRYGKAGPVEALIQVAMLTPEQKAKYCGEQKP